MISTFWTIFTKYREANIQTRRSKFDRTSIREMSPLLDTFMIIYAS